MANDTAIRGPLVPVLSVEDELAARVAELEGIIRSRDAFLAIAAHELRNPMHALGLHLLRVQKIVITIGDERLIRAMDGATQALDRYVERATTLLDVSCFNAGHRTLHIEEVDIAGVVRLVAAAHAAEAAHTGATVRLDLPDSLCGRWDRLAIEQIVGNLLNNAIKYGAGSVVDVGLVQEGACVCLSVRDQGPGIPPDDQERIFGQFEQAVSALTRNGFGVGLWLVRSLLEAHGGSIAVDSMFGAGATFKARLPLAPHPTGPQSL